MRHNQDLRAFALLEVLVALLIVSISISGLLNTQNVAIQHIRSAYFHSVASVQATSLAERWKVNRSEAARARELAQWRLEVHKRLPQGDGSIVCKTRYCKVTVSWYDTERRKWPLLLLNVPQPPLAKGD